MSDTQYRVVKVKTGEYRIQYKLSPHNVYDWEFIGGEKIYKNREDAQRWVDRKIIVEE